jgi:F0F1-type ATP synthase delta subunit
MTHEEELAGLEALQKIADAFDRLAKVAERLFDMNVATAIAIEKADLTAVTNGDN